MSEKNKLLHLVSRAERGALLPGEAQILRDAIQLLDDMRGTLEAISRNSTELECLDVLRRAVCDDDAPGRP